MDKTLKQLDDELAKLLGLTLKIKKQRDELLRIKELPKLKKKYENKYFELIDSSYTRCYSYCKDVIDEDYAIFDIIEISTDIESSDVNYSFRISVLDQLEFYTSTEITKAKYKKVVNEIKEKQNKLFPEIINYKNNN